MAKQKFSQKEIADYYNSTQNHYQRWWDLNDTLSVHYGIWEDEVSNFKESLAHTNQVMLNLSQIQSGDCILDAGCGVGGSSFFLNKVVDAEVVGITLSEKQHQLANAKRLELNSEKVSFQIKDYTNTQFDAHSFDAVWACESVCHTVDKSKFLKEAFRVLKPGGKLILADYFLPNEPMSDPKNWVQKWLNLWGISKIISGNEFQKISQDIGFTQVEVKDYSDGIFKSAQRMYYASVFGAFPSELYNLTHPNVTPFAKGHYKSGIYQYKALKKGLWQYKIVSAVKPL